MFSENAYLAASHNKPHLLFVLPQQLHFLDSVFKVHIVLVKPLPEGV